MNPVAKRGIDLLAYTLSGVALASAVIYGMQRLGAGPAPAPSPAAAVPAPSQAAAVPPPAAPAEAPPAAVPIAAAAPAAPPPQPQVSAQDRATFFALQRNCYDAAADNQTGQYPALQASACNRYLQFANERDWDPGTLPAYGRAAPLPPQQQAAQDSIETAAPTAEPQVILVERPGVYDRPRDLSPPHQSSHSLPAPAPAPPAGVAMPIHRSTTGASRPPQN